MDEKYIKGVCMIDVQGKYRFRYLIKLGEMLQILLRLLSLTSQETLNAQSGSMIKDIMEPHLRIIKYI